MANRPGFLCELQKGKLIDTQPGFADTFNYAVRSIDNLEGGRNCKVDRTIPDCPVINVDIPDSPGGVGVGAVEFTGTDSTSTGESNSFTFASAANADVSVTCSGSTITIGVYYI